MFNLYHICLLRAFEHIHMEFARYKCLLLLLLFPLLIIYSFDNDDMKSSKRHILLVSLIFWLKCQLFDVKKTIL